MQRRSLPYPFVHAWVRSTTLLGREQAAGHAGEFQSLHAEVYAEPPYRRNADAGQFAARFAVQRRQPGFVLAEARRGGYLAGYASGMPLRPSTDWWRDLTTQLPEEVTAEHPGRTFALTDLLVRAPWRRQGIAAALHGLILSGRPETGDAHRLARGQRGTARPAQLRLAQGRPYPRPRPSRL